MQAAPVWCLVFKLNPPNFVNRISEECRTILERIVEADVTIGHFFSRDQDEIFISLAAVEPVLIDEATHHVRPSHPCLPLPSLVCLGRFI